MSDENIQPEDAISPGVSTEEPEKEPSLPEVQSHDSIPAVNAYQIKPDLQEKFRELPVKEIIRETQSSILTGKNYDPNVVKKWTINIANHVNEKLREIDMKRYKHVIHVILGERKGQGIKSGVRCVWDSDTDGYTSEIFMNDTIFCVTTVFAVYLY